MRRVALLLLAACATGCAREELLHGLDEAQANEVVRALDESGIGSGKSRDEGAEGRFVVAVRGKDAPRARQVLAERELPRARPPGFAEVFAGGSMVPTPAEEHARYLYALAGELARSVEAIDGVVEARVHVGVSRPDPLRPGPPPPPRAAVLVKCRPASCAAVRGLEHGIRSLVAGATEGLDASGVAVVVTAAAAGETPGEPARRGRSSLLVAVAAVTGAAALALGGAAVRARLRERTSA
jgi:type III secretion protein J